MVNTEDFTERLHEIMRFYDLSAASFADKIDVGRSSISHLLSGRNKPSLDFVMKIIKAFPEVELYWLLNGKGNFPKEVQKVQSESPVVPEQKSQQDLFTDPPTESKDLSLEAGKKGKKIRKVIILYADGTFDAFEN